MFTFCMITLNLLDILVNVPAVALRNEIVCENRMASHCINLTKINCSVSTQCAKLFHHIQV